MVNNRPSTLDRPRSFRNDNRGLDLRRAPTVILDFAGAQVKSSGFPRR